MARRPGNRRLGNRLFIAGAPVLAAGFFAVWFAGPILWTAVISLYDYSPIGANNSFVGLANYREALVEDDLFAKATINSIYFTVANVVLGTLLALLIANAIASLKLFGNLAKLVYFMPTMFTIVAAAVVWEAIFQPRYGILNNGLYYLTELLGLPPFPEIGWTTRTEWSMPTIILFGLWKYLGIRIVILLAAIESIPKMYYEAATIDGVSRAKQFRYITVPLIAPALWFVVITGLINSLQVFEPMFVITDGGPLRSSISLVMLINELGFGRQRFGYGAAVSLLLFAMIMLLTIVLLRVRRRRAAS